MKTYKLLYALPFVLIAAIFGFQQKTKSSDSTVASHSESAAVSAGDAFPEHTETIQFAAPELPEEKTSVKRSEVGYGYDNTEVTVTYDAYGTKLEYRSFGDNPRIRQIVVETRPDGSQTARAFSRSGTIKEIPADQIFTAMRGSADVISDNLGFPTLMPTPLLETTLPEEKVLVAGGNTPDSPANPESADAKPVVTENKSDTEAKPAVLQAKADNDK